MKKIFITAYIIWNLMVYITVSFIFQQWNPILLDAVDRGGFIITGMWVGLVIAGVLTGAHSDYKKYN